ncbi:Thoeris anti-defense Tad2 family protein [Lactococcus garvieae]|nr:hypothetical protein [Lactococcus garvieae]PCS00288.1 hypothetical protein RU85_GL000708 [Lactococcus garvieae]QPR48974.1 hypothetical protein I6G86_00300 [Lactococcus garvieae]
MNIIEATKKSAETNKAIYRKSMPNWLYFPTDSDGCCILFDLDKDKEYSQSGIRWNPKKSDLIADDWEISSDLTVFQ